MNKFKFFRSDNIAFLVILVLLLLFLYSFSEIKVAVDNFRYQL